MPFSKEKYRQMLQDVLISTERNGNIPQILRAFFLYFYLGIFILTHIGLGWGLGALIKTDYFLSLSSDTIVNEVNQSRTTAGVKPIAINSQLTSAAVAKLNDMFENHYFSHVSPQGIQPWHWFEVAGYNYIYAGENLAIDFSDSDSVMQAWLNSPSHRENILNPNYKDIGLALGSGIINGEETVAIVQLFGAQKESVQSIATISSTQQTTINNSATPIKTSTPAANSTPVSSPTPKISSGLAGTIQASPQTSITAPKQISNSNTSKETLSPPSRTYINQPITVNQLGENIAVRQILNIDLKKLIPPTAVMGATSKLLDNSFKIPALNKNTITAFVERAKMLAATAQNFLNYGFAILAFMVLLLSLIWNWEIFKNHDMLHLRATLFLLITFLYVAIPLRFGLAVIIR